MSERLLPWIAAVLAACVLGVLLFWQPASEAPRPLPPTLPPGGDFVLDSAAGPVALQDYRGKLVLIYFGYTYCPDICPTSLAATVGGLQQLTADERGQVAMLFVSVDPERDTPARLKGYVEFFDPALRGLSGPPARIAEVAARYGVTYARSAVATAGDGYVVDHTAETYLVGRDGRLLARIAHATPPAQVAALLRSYLATP